MFLINRFLEKDSNTVAAYGQKVTQHWKKVRKVEEKGTHSLKLREGIKDVSESS